LRIKITAPTTTVAATAFPTTTAAAAATIHCLFYRYLLERVGLERLKAKNVENIDAAF
jgi:hypothetical protein